jgi:hypothetical protein
MEAAIPFQYEGSNSFQGPHEDSFMRQQVFLPSSMRSSFLQCFHEAVVFSPSSSVPVPVPISSNSSAAVLISSSSNSYQQQFLSEAVPIRSSSYQQQFLSAAVPISSSFSEAVPFSVTVKQQMIPHFLV